jgi:hypothetical protein
MLLGLVILWQLITQCILSHIACQSHENAISSRVVAEYLWVMTVKMREEKKNRPKNRDKACTSLGYCSFIG